MVKYISYSGKYVRNVQDADSYGFPLAFLDGTQTETEYDIHEVLGDYRESEDSKDTSLEYKELWMSRGSTYRKITTTLHRQLEGTITELPFSGNNWWYLPIDGWYYQRKWTYYDYYCRIYTFEGFTGKFYISHDSRKASFIVDYSQWCYHQRENQRNMADRYLPRFEGYELNEWMRQTVNGSRFKEMKTSTQLATAKRAIELAVSCMTSPVPDPKYPDHPLGKRNISIHTPGEIDGLLALSDLRQYKLPYIDQCYLAQLAYQDIGYIDNNGIAFVHDLLEFRHLLTGMVDTIKKTLNSSNNKRRVQGAAQTYLAEHYGLRLMFADIKDYAKKIRRITSSDQFYSDRRCSSSLDLSSDSGWKGVARYTCYYNMESDSDAENFSEILRLLDLVPSLENIWDLMPWTFVIDWFISLGDELTALDNAITLSTAYSVKGWTITCDVEREVQPLVTDPTLAVDLTEHYFSRRIGKVPILPLPPINVAQSTSSPLDHFVEGAALVVTNR